MKHELQLAIPERFAQFKGAKEAAIAQQVLETRQTAALDYDPRLQQIPVDKLFGEAQLSELLLAKAQVENNHQLTEAEAKYFGRALLKAAQNYIDNNLFIPNPDAGQYAYINILDPAKRPVTDLILPDFNAEQNLY